MAIVTQRAAPASRQLIRGKKFLFGVNAQRTSQERERERERDGGREWENCGFGFADSQTIVAPACETVGAEFLNKGEKAGVAALCDNLVNLVHDGEIKMYRCGERGPICYIIKQLKRQREYTAL